VTGQPVWARKGTVASLAVGAALFVGYFTWGGWFAYDDFVYFLDAQRRGMSPSFLVAPLNVHFSPGHRLVDWALQSFAPLNFGVGQVLLLACFAISLVVFYYLLVEMFEPGPAALVLTALYATSVINVSEAQYWGSGLQGYPSVLASLVAMLAWLRFRRNGSRRTLHIAIAALSLGLVFYIKPVLVVVYLVLVEVLLLHPSPRLGDAADAVARRWRAWVPLLVPTGVYTFVYLTRYWRPSGLPGLTVVGRYLWLSWAQVFAPHFFGFHFPPTGPSPTDGSTVVAVQVGVAVVVVISLVRSRRAWRAWAFFATVFVANALLPALPRLAEYGPGVASQLRYYPEINYLFPISLGAAFLRPRPLPNTGPGGTTRPIEPSALHNLRGVGWPAAAWAAVAVLLVAHVAFAASASRRLIAESPGPTTHAFLHRLEPALHRLAASPTASVVDGRFPQDVLGVPGPYGYKYSEILPLIDDRVVFDRPDRSLYRVGGDGNFEPVVFAPEAGGDATQLVDTSRLTVTHGTLSAVPGAVCVTAAGVPEGASLVDFSPPTPLTDADWYLDLRYSSTDDRVLPLFVDHGGGFPYLDRAVALERGTMQSALAELGSSGLSRVRLAVPPGGRVCIQRLNVGRLVPGGSGGLVGIRALHASDSFDRAPTGRGLGTLAEGLPWRADSGAWGTARSQAYVSGPAAGPNLAVADVGGGDASVSVRVARVTNGAGVVFRYRDRNDYWAVVAVPGYATWSVVRTVDGKQEQVGGTGLSAVDDGTTIGVRTHADTIEVLVNGTVATVITDPALAAATMVGMTVDGSDAGRARFDDFAFTAGSSS